MTGHLIHVGYPKAGSTFLQRWFELHPQLRFADGGVAGFRSVYEMCHARGESYRYHVTSAEGLSFPHESTGGLRVHRPGKTAEPAAGFKEKQAEVCALLRDLFPGSRVLVVTRGFRGMVLSGYSQYVRSGGTLDPAAMCRQLAGRLRDDEHHYYDFDHLIGMYAEAFGEEHVTVLPYELLRDDVTRFVRVLEERLGLEHAAVGVGRVNPSLTPEELYWYPRISRAAWAVSRLAGGRRERAFRWYAARAFGERLHPLTRVLRRVSPGRRVDWSDFPAELLRHCEGKAERLRNDPLYAPYAADYLW